MKTFPIKSSFIYPDIKPSDYRFGSFSGEILREDGDWRDYLPTEETQRNSMGVDSSACYIEAQQHAIATILEESMGILNSNFSARFNALLSNGTVYGGSPIDGIESIRKDGLIDEKSMPFLETFTRWSEYHSWVGSSEEDCRQEGKEFLEQYKINYQIVFEKYDTIEEKYRKLREALKRSPVPLSVYAWVQDEQGVYVKTNELVDNHMVLCVYVDENNCPYIWDTYSPFLKKLQPLYPHDFALEIAVTQLEPIKKKTWWELFINFLKELFK